MNQCPEVTAAEAIATTLDMPLISRSTHEIYISIGADTTLLVIQEGSDASDNPDPAAPWLVQFEFTVLPGKLPTEPTALARELASALVSVAAVIGKAGRER